MRDILFVIAFTGILAGCGSFLLHFLRRDRGSFLAGTLCSMIAYLALTIDLLTGLFSKAGSDYLHAICWLMLTCYFAAVYKLKNRLIGAVFTPIIALLMGVAAFADGIIASKAVQGNFFFITHIIVLLASFALFFICFAGAFLYLTKVRAIKAHRSSALDKSLPPLEKLTSFIEKTFNASWVLMTVGILLAFISYFTGDRGGADSNMMVKVTWGVLQWLAQTVFFILYNSHRVHARALARAVCFIALGALLFLLYLSLCPVPNKGKKPAKVEAVSSIFEINTEARSTPNE